MNKVIITSASSEISKSPGLSKMGYIVYRAKRVNRLKSIEARCIRVSDGYYR